MLDYTRTIHAHHTLLSGTLTGTYAQVSKAPSLPLHTGIHSAKWQVVRVCIGRESRPLF